MGPILGVMRTSDMRVLSVILYLGFIEVSVCTGRFDEIFASMLAQPSWGCFYPQMEAGERIWSRAPACPSFVCSYLRHLRTRISWFSVIGVCREVGFLFQKSLIVQGADFISVVCEAACEFDTVHIGLNIGI